MTPQEAFDALRDAGLKHDDAALVKMFDIDADDFVTKAKAAKPWLFGTVADAFDARAATEVEVQARLSEANRETYRGRLSSAATVRTMAELHAQYGAPQR